MVSIEDCEGVKVELPAAGGLARVPMGLDEEMTAFEVMPSVYRVDRRQKGKFAGSVIVDIREDPDIRVAGGGTTAARREEWMERRGVDVVDLSQRIGLMEWIHVSELAGLTEPRVLRNPFKDLEVVATVELVGKSGDQVEVEVKECCVRGCDVINPQRTRILYNAATGWMTGDIHMTVPVVVGWVGRN